MDPDLEEIEQQYRAPQDRTFLLRLTCWFIGGASFLLMMQGSHALDYGDHRGWWTIGAAFILPEALLFCFLRYASMFDGPTPKRWAFADSPLVPVVVTIVFAHFLYSSWRDTALAPPWSVPAPANLSTITGILASKDAGCEHDCASVGQILLDGGRIFQFTCRPGMATSDCMSPDTYRAWIGKDVNVRYFATNNYNGPDNVVVDVKASSGNRELVTYDERMPQLARFRSGIAHANFMHIWMVLLALGAVATAVFRRVPDPDHQY